MSKPIVVALDPQRTDDAPLVLGARLAELAGAPLIVAAAYPFDPVTHGLGGAAVDDDVRSSTLRNLEARTAGLPADLLVRGGPSTARVLHELADELQASVLVIGSTHRGPVGRVAPGSTADRLLHGVSCPVAIAPQGLAADWTLNRVGVGYVDLRDGHGALRAAGAIGRAAGIGVHALTAVEPIDRSGSAAIAPYGAGGSDEATSIAQRELDAAIADLPAGVHATGEVRVAHPVDALAELSAEVDLLVCGSRGYGPRMAVLLGGVTHALVRRAACPLLVVPRGTDSALADLTSRREATTT
jgi:nucleotide-binding universal stress UspA family protein